MYMKHAKRQLLLSLAMLVMASGTLFSQGKKYTLHDVIPGGKSYYNHSPKSISRPVLTSDRLIYFEGGEWVSAPFNKPTEKTPFLNQEQWQALTGQDRLVGSFSESRDGSFLIAQQGGIRYHLAPDMSEVLAKYKLLPRGAAYSSTATGPVAQSYEHNLYVIYPDQEPKAISTDGTREVVYGEVPHRNEFGIDAGMYWSPKGRYLAFYRMDQSMVTDYPLVNTQTRIATHTPIKYPMAGMASHQVTVGIYDTQDGSVKYLNTGEPVERYFTNLAWSPDESLLYIDEVNRGQDTCQLIPYNVVTGEPGKMVLQETHPKYIEPQHPIVFADDRGETFVRLSRKDGYNHLFLYNIDGRLVRQLTGGQWEITSFYGVDKDYRFAYFVGNEGNPTERRVGSVALKNRFRNNLKYLTEEPGYHFPLFNSDFTAMVDRYSSKDVPSVVDVYYKKHNRWRSNNFLVAENPEEGYERPKVEMGTIKDASGVYDLHYKITYPAHIEPGEKLPTIVYVYGGPHAQLVTNSWGSLNRGWDIYMAQEGYVVFTVDGRGSANRGLDFENAIFRNLGYVEMRDQMKGIEFLKSLPFVDPDRIGVHGWSYGGFMTTNLMLSYPDVFKVGVAGGPVMDWSLYEIMYGERYMDTPQDNSIGYKASNLVDRAGNLKGRLLLIHGDQDPVVVWQHSIKFLKAAVDADTYPDYMIYPGYEHNVVGRDRHHLYKTITRYFDDHLKPLNSKK